MPSVLLQAPHFEQSRDGACLPACVRMALAYWGDLRREADIASLLGTKSFGTPISNVARLQDWGYESRIGSLTLPELEMLLNDGVPVIARVWTGFLDHWQQATSHVVLIVGYDDRHIIMDDPGIATAPVAVLLDTFLAAWAEFDEEAVVVRPIVQDDP